MRIRSSEITTYLLCVIAASLAVYVLWVDRNTPTTGEVSARAGMLLRVWREEDINRVTITYGTDPKEVTTIERHDSTWKMLSPKESPVDFIAMMSLFNGLRGARAERAVGQATAEARANFGLDAPRSTVEFTMKNMVIKISLGKVVPPAMQPMNENDAGVSSAYVEVAPYANEKGGIYVVSADVAAVLNRNANAYRETSLLLGNVSNSFRSIRVRFDTHENLFQRSEHGTWRLSTPFSNTPVRVDSDAINSLFSAFAELKAAPFLDDSTTINESQKTSLEIEKLTGEKISVALGGRCPTNPQAIVAQLHNPIVSTGCVPAFVLDSLQRDKNYYIDTHAFALLHGSESQKISEIESVLIEQSGSKILDVERRNDGLHQRVPTDVQLNREQSERLLKRFSQVHGEVIAPSIEIKKLGRIADSDRELQTLGLKPAAGIVKLRRRIETSPSAGPNSKNTIEEQVVEIGTRVYSADNKTSFVFLHRLDDNAILKLSTEDAEALGPAVLRELRSATLLDVSPNELTKIAVSINAKPQYSLEHKSSNFVLLEPKLSKDFGADPTLGNEILQHISSLTCLRWVEQDLQDRYGLRSPSMTIEVQKTNSASGSSNNTSTFMIDVGSTAHEGGVYTQIRGNSGVCIVPELKIEALKKVPIDRAIVGFDPTNTSRLVLTRSRIVRTLIFSQKTWRDGSNATSPSLDTTARKIADQIVTMRTEALIHIGPALPSEGFASPSLIIEGFDGQRMHKKLIIGDVGRLGNLAIYYARVDGIDATFAILREDIEHILTMF